jgi:prolyl-tRNA synthetase
MRWTQTLIPTLRQTPADAQMVSHQLMLRAGLIRQVAAGAFDFLPLGLRSLHKAAQIVREEMDVCGCAEVLLPSLQPMELWQKTGRSVSYGPNLMRLKDRHGREMILGPTHEEVITELVSAYINSYKQLPLGFYQIQTKFRDEYRPRFGLMRCREFLMKDAYSFHATQASLDQWYTKLYAAYERIFRRCGIAYTVVEAASGEMGGTASHEFMVICDAGEDVLLESDKGNYHANLEHARTGNRAHDLSGQPQGELEIVHTPGMHSIDEVASFLHIPPAQMLKTLVYQASPGPGPAFAPRYVIAVVRGDHDVNEAKLQGIVRERMNVGAIQLADTPELQQRFAIGFVGPDAAMREFFAVLIIDPDAAQDCAWVAGANEADHHVRNFNWFRDVGDRLADPTRTLVADIRNAVYGDPSPLNDGGILHVSRGIEIGHVFKLGTKYSSALDACFLDDQGQKHPIIMGCYGIGIARMLIAAVEASHDEHGIIWPGAGALAPYCVCITPVRYDGETRAASDSLYGQLTAAGVDTILDDRDMRAGAKFADADLVGFPIRINVGDRSLKEGRAEIKQRREAKPTAVPLDQVVSTIRAMLAEHAKA